VPLQVLIEVAEAKGRTINDTVARKEVIGDIWSFVLGCCLLSYIFVNVKEVEYFQDQGPTWTLL
jgi:hypothetical protein